MASTTKDPPVFDDPRSYVLRVFAGDVGMDFYFSGSVIRFGKLTMTAADLQLIDLDERDPFDFHPAKYNDQLVAGYSKNTPAKGLKTYMPDFADLKPGLDLRPRAR